MTASNSGNHSGATGSHWHLLCHFTNILDQSGHCKEQAQPSSHPQLPASNPMPAQVSMNTSDDLTQDKVSSSPLFFFGVVLVQTRNFPNQLTTQLQIDLGWPREGSSIWVENGINIVVAVQLNFSWKHDQTSPFTFTGVFHLLYSRHLRSYQIWEIKLSSKPIYFFKILWENKYVEIQTAMIRLHTLTEISWTPLQYTSILTPQPAGYCKNMKENQLVHTIAKTQVLCYAHQNTTS